MLLILYNSSYTIRRNKIPSSTRIATGVIHLNIHITEPDFEFLGRIAHPVIDDPDDVLVGFSALPSAGVVGAGSAAGALA